VKSGSHQDRVGQQLERVVELVQGVVQSKPSGHFLLAGGSFGGSPGTAAGVLGSNLAGGLAGSHIDPPDLAPFALVAVVINLAVFLNQSHIPPAR
jgi:hypothetical protein